MTFPDDRASADLLWRLNQTYVQRLGKARSLLTLLAQLMVERGADTAALAVVKTVQAEGDRLYADHKRWRYTYLYQEPAEQRMVQETADVGRALAQFARLRQKHAQHASEIAVYLSGRRPTLGWTTMAQGDDLWQLTLEAFADLQTVEYA